MDPDLITFVNLRQIGWAEIGLSALLGALGVLVVAQPGDLFTFQPPG